MIWRLCGVAVAVILTAAVGLVALTSMRGQGASPTPAVFSPVPTAAAPRGPLPCADDGAFAAAAAANAVSLTSAEVVPFRRPETGWEIYAPLASREIGSGCPPEAPGFAAALAVWQAGHRLPATGIMDEPTLDALARTWLARRPFVAATAHGTCPPAPPPETLAWVRPDEGYSGKPVQLRQAALAAYRTMVAAARAESPAVAADHRLLTVFSGFRDPDADAARCALGGCGGPERANCSAHRTGLALDLYLGNAPGFAPESSADANRLYQARSPAFAWMASNAARFGFANYPFEPWHWEWTGEAP